MTALALARQYIARGWAPVPIPFKDKKCVIDGWSKLKVTDATVTEYFSTEPMNIGVLLGAPSNNLVDVDLDTPEARAVALFFLPKTHAVFGRKSSRAAHYLYQVDKAPGTKAFNDPTAKAEDEKARIIELRGTGGQTVFPGSTHRDTGELIEWEQAGDPAKVPYNELLQACQRVAAFALIAQQWHTGTRDDLCTATIGITLRAGFTDQQIEDALRGIGAAADDEKIDTRMEKIPRLRREFESGGRLFGFPKLAELTDTRVADVVRKWLGVRGDGDFTVRREDFYAYMPAHKYIFVPTRELWPGSSVDAKCAPPPGGMSPTAYLDLERSVEQMTWAPGEPLLIRDRLVSDGGWIDRVGCSTFNLYREPAHLPGDPAQAEPWLAHVQRIYPSDHHHIVLWLAHRVQRPGEKINHALVLGGAQGIGKDTLLEPVKHAVGPWNFVEVGPAHLIGRFNGFVKSVILRVSEARDLGDINRYGFYEHMKVYTAAPPDVLRCDEKNLREHAVMNVTGVIITTNHKTNGIYLPADDRRHYVAWSDATKEQFPEDYWRDLWRWYGRHGGGFGHVAAYLRQLDLSAFNAKAPPAKTPAFWDIVDANRAPEDAELADVLERLGNPPAVTIGDLLRGVSSGKAFSELGEWLTDRRNARALPHRMESAGYVSVRNEADKRDGLWKMHGDRCRIYAQKELSVKERFLAAAKLVKESHAGGVSDVGGDL